MSFLAAILGASHDSKLVMEAPSNPKLLVEVVEAKELGTSISEAKAFCQLQYDGQVRSTREVLEWTNPSWNEKFEFVIKSITMPGDLEIYWHRFPYIGLESCLRVAIPVCDVPERPGAEPGDLRWYPLQKPKGKNLTHGYLRLRIWITREDRDLQSILGNFPQAPSHPPNFIRNLGHTRNSERLMECKGSSSASINPVQSNPSYNPFLPGPSHNPHDLHEPANTTNMLESMEGETEQVINERMESREAHLQKVKDLVNTHDSHVVEAFDLETRTEWQIHETLPLLASQLVAQSLQRTQSMVASQQTMEIFCIQNNLIPGSIDDAMDKERQLVRRVTNTAKDSVNHQSWLRECDQRLFQADLALMEKQKNERMELFKTFQQEKEPDLNRWADSRRETQKLVQSIESNSLALIQQLNTLVETSPTRREYLASLAGEWSDDESKAEVCEAVGGEAIEETSSSSKLSACQICCNYVEGPSSGTSTTAAHDVKQRSCLIPCLHAMICLPCATRIWKSTKKCPFCKVKLTTKPRPLYLG